MYYREPPDKDEKFVQFGLYFAMPLTIFVFWMIEQGWFGFGS